MDDLQAMLTQLLDSPDGMDKIKSLANSLLNSSQDSSPNTPAASESSHNDQLPAISGDEIATVMTLVKALKNDQEDERSKLLLALRPHLKEERQHKVDQAVKLLKLAKLAPLFSQSGLFNV